MSKIYKGTLGLIGNTPLVEVANVEAKEGLEVRLIYDDMGCVSLLPLGYDRYLEHYFGRSAMFAPEIDGMIYFRAPKSKGLKIGDFVGIKILDVVDNNLIGEVI